MSFREFCVSECGAVSVSWVILVAGLMGLLIGAMAVTSGGVEDLSSEVSQTLVEADPGSEALLGWNGATVATARSLAD